MFRRILVATSTIAIPAALVIGASAPASAAIGSGPTIASAPPSACVGVIQIQQLTFSPAVVAPGGSSTATLVATNCTAQTQDTTATWTGTFTGASTGVPAGCPVIDPLARPADFAPHATITSSLTYTVFSGCTATDLLVTVKITSSTGTLLAVQTADLPIVSPVG